MPAHRFFEDLVAVLVAFLAPVHGDIGLPEQVFGPVSACFAVPAHDDPGAGGDEHLVVVEDEGGSQPPRDPAGNADRLRYVLDVLEQDGELVSAASGHCVIRLQDQLEPVGYLT